MGIRNTSVQKTWPMQRGKDTKVTYEVSRNVLKHHLYSVSKKDKWILPSGIVV
jgi:hypothetical protein